MPQYPQIVSAARAKKFYGIEVISTPPVEGAPVVDPAIFQLTLPTTNGHTVGTVTATNTPTSWAIASGSAGHFAISSGGVITVTAQGAANLVPADRDLTISA